MSFIYFLAIFLFLVICLLLSGVIMMQEGKTAGLGASFGGDSGESVFGTGTADILKQFTSWLALIFFVACILLSFWTASLVRTNVPTKPLIEEVE